MIKISKLLNRLQHTSRHVHRKADKKNAVVDTNEDRYEHTRQRSGPPDGRGVKVDADGSRYEGGFKAGMREGHGVVVWANGNRYEGEFKRGVPNGQGTEVRADGSRYSGGFKNGRKDGYGVYVFASGERYEGEYKGGMRNGHGVVVCANGMRYEGSFKNGWRDGQGIEVYPDGSGYEGEYKADYHEGQGMTWLANGERYEGGFKNDRPDGQGTYVFFNGDRYEGGFKNGSRDGRGVYIFANGRRREGEWEDGRLLVPRVPSRDMQAMLADAQNVHATGRNQRTREAVAALKRILHFSDDAQTVEQNLNHVMHAIETIHERDPASTPAWMWQPRAGRLHDLDNALHAMQGEQLPNDFTGPILQNKPMANLLALIWHAIEAYPQHAPNDAAASDTQKLLRYGVLKALAECIEQEEGVVYRVCNVGISQRLISVLQGYYPRIFLDNFAVDPRELVTLVSQAFAEENGDVVTQRTVDAFRQKSLGLAQAHFAAGSPELGIFGEHLEAWIAYDLSIQPEPAATPAALIAQLIADFETQSAHQRTEADLRAFRRSAQETVSRHFALQSPQWRESICGIAAYCQQTGE